MSLGQLTQLARCNGLHTMTFRPKVDDQDDVPQKKPLWNEALTIPHKHNLSCCKITDDTECINHKRNSAAAYIYQLDYNLMKTLVVASARQDNLYAICNLSRRVLGQTGDGHFVNIGAYHSRQSKTLLMDTARFKYPPHWVDMNLLYQSLQTMDSASGLPRGLIIASNKLEPEDDRSVPLMND